MPVAVALYYGEATVHSFGFAAVSTAVLGLLLSYVGSSDEPTISEALYATVLGWFIAVFIGATPLLEFMSPVDAVFESTAGLTTTGISMLLAPEALPKSMLFWRAFMQWIGGLGILTFFIAVIRESGGISRRLFSAEAHKTDPGSIRPSLKKSIVELWRVYGFLTMLIMGTFIGMGMSVFDSFAHAFATISTGGFSTLGASMSAFPARIQAATVFFMFIGGVNFVLLYRFLRADIRPIRKNSEFKLYTTIFLAVSGLVAIELIGKGLSPAETLLNSTFTSAAVISSTGFSTIGVTSLSIALQALFLGVMFVGGSLGSTAGGLKVFRLKALFELLKTRLRAYSLPETAVNEPKIDGEILSNSVVRTISVLFFVWVGVIFVATLGVLVVEDVSFMAALSGTISAAGNMGPVYMEGQKMVALSPVTKSIWVVVMLAGRLEMLPLLALFNKRILKNK
ncbi:TrkH family potassium uptake protein [Candidatus Nanohalovita haloferacivicina]|uniref:TrkH family potassium uptake protein n=1 Tax=Candidatus Nanohalovita haloferacivicina TaxID=2978046 RepID=UPI00325FB561